jgi:hypothetical protein
LIIISVCLLISFLQLHYFPQENSITLVSVADCYISEDYPNLYNDATFVNVESHFKGNQRALVRFDLNTLPAGANVKSAYLKLYQLRSISFLRYHDVYRVTAVWYENHEHSIWSLMHDKHASKLEDRQPVFSVGWVTWDVSFLVQSWINGSYINYGFMIIDSEENSSIEYITRYASRNNLNADIRPKLEITYTVLKDRSVKNSSTVTMLSPPAALCIFDLSRKAPVKFRNRLTATWSTLA